MWRCDVMWRGVAWRTAIEGAGLWVQSLVLLSSSLPPFFISSSNLNSVSRRAVVFWFLCGIKARAREMPATTYTLQSKCQTSNHRFLLYASRLVSPHLILHSLCKHTTHTTHSLRTKVDSIISFKAKTTVLSK